MLRHIFAKHLVFFSFWSMLIISLFFGYLPYPIFSATGINPQINFQGKLVKSDGTNVPDGTYTVVFSIYNNPNVGSGTQFWTETDSVTTTNGIFRVPLGATTALPASINFNWSGMYLGIQITKDQNGTNTGDSEMSPRVQFTAVPYAFNSQTVAGLTVQDTSGNASTSGTLQVANGSTIAFANTSGSTLTFTASGTTNATLPTTGSISLVDLATAQNLTSKTYNGLSITGTTPVLLQPNAAGGLSLDTNGSNTLLLAGANSNQITLGRSSGVTIKLPGFGGGSSNSNAVLYVDSSNNLGQAVTGAAATGTCLTTNGTGLPTWGSCGSGTAGANYWIQQSGIGVSNGGYTALGNLTSDLLIGGTATSSAEFSVLNVIGGGLPTASVSAGLSSSGTSEKSGVYIDAGGDVQTVGRTMLTLGGSTTGDIQFKPGGQSSLILTSNGNVGIGVNVTNPPNPLNVNGTVSNTAVILLGGSATGTSAVTSDLTLNGSVTVSNTAAGTSQGVLIAPTINVNADAQTEGIRNQAAFVPGVDLVSGGGIYGTQTNIRLSGTSHSVSTVYIVDSKLKNDGTYTGIVGTNIGFFAEDAQSFSGGEVTNQAGLNVVGLSAATNNTLALLGTQSVPSGNYGIYDSSTYQNYLAGNLGIGTTAPSSLFQIVGTNAPTASISANSAYAGLVVDNKGGTANLGDIFTASSSGLTRFVIQNNGNVGIGVVNPQAYLEIPGANNGGVPSKNAIQTDSGSFKVDTNGNTYSPGFYYSNNSNWEVSIQNGQTYLPGFLTLNNASPNLPLATLDIRSAAANNITAANFGTLPIASISGSTSFASVVIDNTGKGDLFTASTSGLARFIINNNGNVTVNGATYTTGNNSVLYTNSSGNILAATTAANGNCLVSGGTGTAPSWGSCATGSQGPNYWIQQSGIGVANGGYTALGNTTTDLLIGGVSTASADFGIINLSPGKTPDGFMNGQFDINAASALGIAGSTIGTTPASSISAKTSFAAVLIDNKGAGDIFTASSSGLTRFTITNSGVVEIGNLRPTAQNLEIDAGFLPANDLVDIGNVVGQEPTVSGINALQTTWNVKPASGNIISGFKSIINNNNTATGGLAGGIRITPTGVGGIINSPTDGLFIDGLAKASVGTTSQNAIEIGTNWDSSVFGEGDLRINANGNVLIGTSSATTRFGFGTSTPLSNFDIRGNSGTLSVASVSGTTSFASLVVNNNGLGDLFTASSSGLTQFVIQQNGNIGIGTSSAAQKLDVEGGNIMIGSQANTAAAATQTWTAVSNAAGQLSTAASSGIASISASTVYNGSLYVGTAKNSAAEVYRYNGSTGIWARISTTTPGQILTTTNISTISAMTVYNNRLIVGTSKPGGAEVYQYDGTNWSVISQATAGTIRSGGTTQINAITAMAVYDGKLFIGTGTTNGRAEVYRYDGGTTWTAIDSVPGTIVQGGSAAYDAVAAMVVANNLLYIGVNKFGLGAIYVYSTGVGGTSSWVAEGNSPPDTTVNGITAMAEWNGHVYFGTTQKAKAEVMRVDDSNTWASQTATNFVIVSSAQGTIATGGTGSIDQVSSMAVYNNKLYIGTLIGNSNDPGGKAEVYRYDGDTNWTRVSQGAAGQIGGPTNAQCNNGTCTTAIDGVTVLQPYNGSLFAGTEKMSGSAEIYQYTNTLDQSYSLVFHASTSQSPEQNGFFNTGSISFIASQSASVYQGSQSTGQFVFDHGITTSFGAYDVAEDYGTRDTTLQPGDVVSIDPNEGTFVDKSQPFDQHIIGVFSANPGIRLSQADSTINGGEAIPIALSGRVPVNVTTENGDIKPGDYLTSSSIPGVAAKAIKAGPVIGQAMESYSGTGVGQITAFIKAATFNGSFVDGDSPVGMTLDSQSQQTSDLQTLGKLVDQTNSDASTQSGGLSQVYADQLIASKSVIAPRVVTQDIMTRQIEAQPNSDLLISIGKNNKLIIASDASSSAALTIDSNGNAIFAGDIYAKSIHADQIVGLTSLLNSKNATNSATQDSTVLLNRIANLESSVASLEASFSLFNQTSTLSAQFASLILPNASTSGSIASSLTSSGGMTLVQNELDVQGGGLFEGVLSVVDTITTHNLIVTGISDFFDNVVFHKDVQFSGRATFNNDTAGYAVVNKNANKVQVNFSKPYDNSPVVSISISTPQLTDQEYKNEIASNTCVVSQSIGDCQNTINNLLLSENIHYVVTNISTKGFEILLDKSASNNVYFSWQAVSVDNPKTVTSDGKEVSSTN